MKKLLFLMMALMVAPAMAAVELSIVDNADCTADIVVTVTGTDLNANLDSALAGIALDLSVSAGTIEDVTNYFLGGVSTDGDEGMGIYMGSIQFTGGTPEAILDVGSPVAPVSDEDAPGQLGTSEITLEFGCLHDMGDAALAGAPLAVTTLCTVEVSEACDLTLTADAKRGGPVLLGGADPSSDNLPVTGPITCAPPQCYIGPDQAEYAKYIAAGWTHAQMASWCNIYQCDGDVMNNVEIFLQDYRVYISDLNELLAHWQKKINDPTLNPAADVSHDAEIFLQDYRVYISDLNKLLSRWTWKDPAMPGLCNTP